MYFWPLKVKNGGKNSPAALPPAVKALCPVLEERFWPGLSPPFSAKTCNNVVAKTVMHRDDSAVEINSSHLVVQQLLWIEVLVVYIHDLLRFVLLTHLRPDFEPLDYDGTIEFGGSDTVHLLGLAVRDHRVPPKPRIQPVVTSVECRLGCRQPERRSARGFLA